MMRDNFGQCLEFTLKWEGSWSDDPRDPGGATMHGVTLATFSQFLGRKASKTELRNISSEQLEKIYRLRFWNLVNGDDLPKGVDLMLFDIAVNSGPGRADKFDEATMTIRDVSKRIIALDKFRMGFWRHLRTWPVFGKGWSRRETACLHLAMSMANLAAAS